MLFLKRCTHGSFHRELLRWPALDFPVLGTREGLLKPTGHPRFRMPASTPLAPPMRMVFFPAGRMQDEERFRELSINLPQCRRFAA